MKKKIVLILATLMCISLCACGGNASGNSATDDITNNDEQAPNFVGLWIDEECKTYLIVREDGSARLYDGMGHGYSSVKYEQGKLKLTQKDVLEVVASGSELELHYGEEDIVLKKESDIPQEPLVINTSGIKKINDVRFKDCLEVVHITAENWREYMTVKSYTKVVERTDAFGEVVSSETVEVYEIGAEVDGYYRYEGIIELEHKETKEKIIVKGGKEVEPTFSFDDYECTRVQMKFYHVTLPEEVVYSPLPEWNYGKGFVLGSEGHSAPYGISETGLIGHNGNEDWEEKFMNK